MPGIAASQGKEYRKREIGKRRQRTLGAAQAKLSEQPEMIELLRVLEQNKLVKEQQEVEALVNYLDNMEN